MVIKLTRWAWLIGDLRWVQVALSCVNIESHHGDIHNQAFHLLVIKMHYQWMGNIDIGDNNDGNQATLPFSQWMAILDIGNNQTNDIKIF